MKKKWLNSLLRMVSFYLASSGPILHAEETVKTKGPSFYTMALPYHKLVAGGENSVIEHSLELYLPLPGSFLDGSWYFGGNIKNQQNKFKNTVENLDFLSSLNFQQVGVIYVNNYSSAVDLFAIFSLAKQNLFAGSMSDAMYEALFGATFFNLNLPYKFLNTVKTRTRALLRIRKYPYSIRIDPNVKHTMYLTDRWEVDVATSGIQISKWLTEDDWKVFLGILGENTDYAFVKNKKVGWMEGVQIFSMLGISKKIFNMFYGDLEAGLYWQNSDGRNSQGDSVFSLKIPAASPTPMIKLGIQTYIDSKN